MNLQIDNINEIEFLRKSLDELCGYGIDIELYKSKLDTAIADYESSKKRELDNEFNRLDGKMVADLENSAEVSLCLELEKLSNSLVWYMLFLDLMHVTDDWSLEVKIDDVFSRIYNKLDKVLECLVSIDLQKKVISRYYDLVLKKLLIDYESNRCEHIDEFDNLGKNVYLTDSVNRYLRYNNIWVDGRIDSYSLRKAIDKINDRKKVSSTKKEEIEVIENDKELVVSKKDKINFLCGIRKRILNNLSSDVDLYSPEFDWLGSADRSQILKRVGLNNLKSKIFMNCDLRGLDLSSVDFESVIFENVNLANTWARIDPQKILNKCLKTVNVDGCYIINEFSGYKLEDIPKLSRAVLINSFNDIDEIEKKFKEMLDPCYDCYGDEITKKNIIVRVPFKYIIRYDISYSDLSNIDLSQVDFSKLEFKGTKLQNTKARIDPQKVFASWFVDLRVSGCYIINDFYGYGGFLRSLRSECFNGAILVHSFDEIPTIEKLMKCGFYNGNFKLGWQDNLYLIDGKLIEMNECDMRKSKYYSSLRPMKKKFIKEREKMRSNDKN